MKGQSPRATVERMARTGVTAATLAALAVLWTLFALWAATIQNGRREALEHTLDAHRAAVSEQVASVFKVAETFLALADRWIADNPDRDPRSDPAFANLVHEFQRVTGDAMLVRLVEGDGTLRLIPATPGAIPANVADRDYAKEAMASAPGKIAISAPFKGRSTGLWAVAAATRLSQPSHGVAVAMVALELRLFDAAFDRVRANGDWVISLARRDGILLARSATKPSDLIGRDLSKLPVFAEKLPNQSHGALITDGRLTDGVRRLTAFGALPSAPLVVIVGAPMDAFEQEGQAMVWRVGAILALVTALAFASRWKIISLLDGLSAGQSELARSHDRLTQEIEERRAVEDALHRSETDLRSILDNLIDVFYRTDAEGRITMISRSVEAVLGYTVAEVLGHLATDYHANPEGRSTMLAALSENGGRAVDFELQMRHKTLGSIWVATSSRLMLDERGQPCGVEGVFRSIEERRAVERALREHGMLTQSLLNASTDATMLFKRDGTLLAVNKVLADRFGKTPEQLPGVCLWDLFPPETSAGRRAAMEKVIESGEAAHFIDQRGQFHFDNSIYPVANENGIIDKIAVYSRDITQQVKADSIIAGHMAELARSNAELEQFAYVASHDLREPLRMISSYLSLIERRYGQLLGTDGGEFLAFARDGAKRMDNLVLDLLDYSRIDRRGDPMIAMPLQPALDQALRHLGVAIQESGATVTTDESFAAATVKGDPNQIMRLFQNLIGNALKYRDAARPPEIRLGCVATGDGAWEISVADNGIGIEAEYFERIFGIFQRLHTRDAFEGTGIGLAICKKIVERHGGRIWLESVPGQGTTFRLTLMEAHIS